jgi:transcription initiation factor TFIID subunit 7
MVNKRGAMSDVWFKVKGQSYPHGRFRSDTHNVVDPRRAVFHIVDSLHPAKLVDLPCILESQKTLDNKHMFKVADICQVSMKSRITQPFY